MLVRSVDRITGHLIGFLVAFDKHWNMALTDVEETFTYAHYLTLVSDSGQRWILENSWQSRVAKRELFHAQSRIQFF